MPSINKFKYYFIMVKKSYEEGCDELKIKNEFGGPVHKIDDNYKIYVNEAHNSFQSKKQEISDKLKKYCANVKIDKYKVYGELSGSKIGVYEIENPYTTYNPPFVEGTSIPDGLKEIPSIFYDQSRVNLNDENIIKDAIERTIELNKCMGLTELGFKNLEPNNELELEFCERSDLGDIESIFSGLEETMEKNHCNITKLSAKNKRNRGMSFDLYNTGVRDVLFKINPLIEPFKYLTLEYKIN